MNLNGRGECFDNLESLLFFRFFRILDLQEGFR